MSMSDATSRITAQGQTSVPAEIRKRLGLGPGSVLTWDVEGDHVVVRRKGDMTFEEIRKALFPDGPPRRRTVEEIDEGIARAVRERWKRARR